LRPEPALGYSHEFPMRETVLIVDENRTARRRVRDVLQREGYETREAASALEAMMVALAAAPPVAVLVTDTGLHGIDGTKLSEKLSGSFPAIRVIYMADGEAVVEMRDRGCVCLAKPVDPQDLAASVAAALSAPPRKKETTLTAAAFIAEKTA
jgi:DNA-binding NtrC family response regulator